MYFLLYKDLINSELIFTAACVVTFGGQKYILLYHHGADYIFWSFGIILVQSESFKKLCCKFHNWSHEQAQLNESAIFISLVYSLLPKDRTNSKLICQRGKIPLAAETFLPLSISNLRLKCLYVALIWYRYIFLVYELCEEFELHPSGHMT